MKRQRCPPPRLSWPVSKPLTVTNESKEHKIPANYDSLHTHNHDSNQPISLRESSTRQNTTHYPNSKYIKNRHSKRNSNSRQNRNYDARMWTEKYSNLEESKDLCLQPRKIKEVKAWIESALSSSNKDASKFLLLVGSPGIGKSTMCHVLAKELELGLLEWSDAQSSIVSHTKYESSSSLLSFNYQSSLSSFQEFLQSAASGCGSLDLARPAANTAMTTYIDKQKRGYLLLIDEIPHLFDTTSEEKFRVIMENHIQVSRYPTILIFSNVSEGKANPSDLEKLIHLKTLYDPSKVKIIQCNPVTQSKMKRCLESIARKERLKIPPGVLDQIYINSGGDLRNAIMSLQFHLVGSQKKFLQKNMHGKNTNQFERDKKLSAFHALGKLLYAKRVSPYSSNDSKETPKVSIKYNDEKFLSDPPPLQFVPEEVIQASEMNLTGIISFLTYHSPSFYTDIEELSDSFELFSDASILLDRKFNSQRDQSDKVFPSEYVSSIAGRSVAKTNKHPTPSKFRALEAPKVYDVLRKRNWNCIKIDKLQLRLFTNESRHETCGNNHGAILPFNSPIGSSKSFVTNDLHFIRIIFPKKIDSTLKNLYSINMKVTKQEHKNDAQETNTQTAIIPEDDIVDDEADFATSDFTILDGHEKNVQNSIIVIDL